VPAGGGGRSGLAHGGPRLTNPSRRVGESSWGLVVWGAAGKGAVSNTGGLSSLSSGGKAQAGRKRGRRTSGGLHGGCVGEGGVRAAGSQGCPWKVKTFGEAGCG